MTFKRLWITRHGKISQLDEMLSKQPSLQQPYNTVLFVRKNSISDYNCILKNQYRVENAKIAIYDEHKMHINHFFHQNPSLSRMIYCNFGIFDLVQKYSESIVISDSYLDNHPLDIYYKLCRLLNYQPSHDILTKLTLSESRQQYLRNNVFYPQIKQLNKRVLKSSYVKLKLRERMMFGEGMPPEQQQQRKEIRTKWEDMINSMELQPISKSELETRILSTNVQHCSLKQYIANKPKLTSYAPIRISC